MDTMIPSVATPYLDRLSSGVREFMSSFTLSEAAYFDEESFSEGDIRKKLSDALPEVKVEGMRRILAAFSTGRDVSRLFPDVVKTVNTSDMELKQLVYIYLVHHSTAHRELALLAINTFQRDLLDRNPFIRASALKAMSASSVLEMMQIVVAALQKASIDSSTYVRKCAAHCIARVYETDQDQYSYLVDILMKLMHDIEVCVVGSAVTSWKDICLRNPPPALQGTGEKMRGETGNARCSLEVVQRKNLEMLHPHYRRLCGCLLQMEPWAQSACIETLLWYSRQHVFYPALIFREADAQCNETATDEGEKENSDEQKSRKALLCSRDFNQFNDSLKLLLQSQYTCVVTQAMTALRQLHLPEPADKGKDAVISPSHIEDARVIIGLLLPPLVRLLRDPERFSCTIEFVNDLLSTTALYEDATFPSGSVSPQKVVMNTLLPHLLVFRSDPLQVKLIKLQLLQRMATCNFPRSGVAMKSSAFSASTATASALRVMRELEVYCTFNCEPEFIQSVTRSVTHLALSVPSLTDRGLKFLISLLATKRGRLAAAAVVGIRTILQHRRTSGLSSLIAHLLLSFPHLEAPTARASVLWILGEYQGEVVWHLPDFLLCLAQTFPEEPEEVKLQVLALATKVWCHHAISGEFFGTTEISSSAQQWRSQIEDRSKQVVQTAAADEVQSATVAPSEGGSSEQTDLSSSRADGNAREASSPLTRAEAFFRRLTLLVEYLLDLAYYDCSYDVRDMVRHYSLIVRACKGLSLEEDGDLEGVDSTAAEKDPQAALAGTGSYPDFLRSYLTSSSGAGSTEDSEEGETATDHTQKNGQDIVVGEGRVDPTKHTQISNDNAFSLSTLLKTSLPGRLQFIGAFENDTASESRRGDTLRDIFIPPPPSPPRTTRGPAYQGGDGTSPLPARETSGPSAAHRDGPPEDDLDAFYNSGKRNAFPSEEGVTRRGGGRVVDGEDEESDDDDVTANDTTRQVETYNIGDDEDEDAENDSQDDGDDWNFLQKQ